MFSILTALHLLLPHLEMRAITVNTHWNNPATDEMTLLYQKYRKAVMYPHKLQHGQTDHHIGVVFHIIEQFDNRDSDQLLAEV